MQFNSVRSSLGARKPLTLFTGGPGFEWRHSKISWASQGGSGEVLRAVLYVSKMIVGTQTRYIGGPEIVRILLGIDMVRAFASEGAYPLNVVQTPSVAITRKDRKRGLEYGHEPVVLWWERAVKGKL